MLRAIHLIQFGMFSGKTFALEPVTIFSGANQSGKSTVFDAIRIHAFHPEKRRRETKEIYERYGDAVEAELDWNDGAPEMSDATFMNLFAISGGDVTMDLGGDWLSAVKKSLFAGGIDPRNLIAHFEKNASEKGSLAHMKKRALLEKSRAEREARLEDLAAERERILDGIRGQATRDADLKGVDARLGVAKGAAAEKAAELAFQERVAERVALEETLALLGRVGETERAQEARRHLSVDRTGELDELEQARRERETERVRTEQASQATGQQLERARGEAARAEREVEIRKSWSEAVTVLEARRARYEDLRFSKGLMRGVAGVALLVLGVGALVLSGLAAWGIFTLVGAALLAVGVFMLPGVFDEWRLRRELQEIWRSRLGGSAGLEEAQGVLDATSVGAVMDALARVRAGLERIEAEKVEKIEALQSLEELQALAEKEDNISRLAFETAQKELQEWLENHQVASRDEYRDRLSEYQRETKQLADAYGRMEALRAKGGFLDNHRLKADAERKLRELDEEAVPRQGLPEEERRALRVEVERLRAEVSGLEREHHALDRERHGASERLAGELGRLPEEIAALGEALQEAQKQLDELEFNRRAAERALGLFEEMVDDETTVLASLSEGVAAIFGRLSGAGGATDARHAAVTLSGLEHGEIRALDRRGKVRPVAHLSSGARHLLYLALRLEMARRERNGRFALLCLDEPFAFLDPDRQMETLQYLREFLEETGWQLVLFTNDPAHAERVRAVFPDCRGYDLDAES